MSPSFPPPEILDTLGAGDTFNATLIHSLLSNKTLKDALIYSCQVAGAKCGFKGYKELRTSNVMKQF